MAKANYIPNRNIKSIKVQRSGKTTDIDGSKVLDGAYVKKGVKYAQGGGFNQYGEPYGFKYDYDYYEVYDDATGKSLMIYAIDQEEAEMIAEELDFESFEDGDEYNPNEDYKTGGRLTSNEDIINSFLTSNREAKVGNISTHYSTLGDVVLLRNYGTLIAKRKGNKVSISNKKYSVTTSKIQNMISRMANDMGLKVEKINEDEFAQGGSMYAKGGGVSSKKAKSMKQLEKHIKYRFINTDMGSGWKFYLDNFDLEMSYIDYFDPEDEGIEDYDSLSKEEKKYYYDDWKETLFEISYEKFKNLAFEKYGYYYMEEGGNTYSYCYTIGGL